MNTAVSQFWNHEERLTSISSSASAHLLSLKVRLNFDRYFELVLTSSNLHLVVPDYPEGAPSPRLFQGYSMQLAALGLIALKLQLCLASYAHAHSHAHIPRHGHTQDCALSSDVGCTSKAAFTRTTTSLLFIEADMNILYPELYTTTSATYHGMETALAKQFGAGFQPTNVRPHHYLQTRPSQGWIAGTQINSSWGLGNRSSPVHHPMFNVTATPVVHGSLKPSISTAPTGGTAGNLHTFSNSGSHGKQRASSFVVVMVILSLAGASGKV